jgi:hypothetical protein
MSFLEQETMCTGCTPVSAQIHAVSSRREVPATASSRRSVPVRAACGIKPRPQLSRWACRRGGVHMCNNLFISASGVAMYGSSNELVREPRLLGGTNALTLPL